MENNTTTKKVLTYWDETYGTYVITHDSILDALSNIVDINAYEDGEKFDISFIIRHMTEEEIDALPEVG